jgi:hypothetical protein
VGENFFEGAICHETKICDSAIKEGKIPFVARKIKWCDVIKKRREEKEKGEEEKRRKEKGKK